MSVIVSFFDYVPPARYDGAAWTTIKVDESPSKDGPWTEIQSFAINPVDADPSHPQARSWTTTTATLSIGWYRVRYIDAVGNFVSTEPIQNVVPDPVEFLPSLSEVGGVTLGRTLDDVGKVTGTFTTKTQPTDDQVKMLTLWAGDDVRRKIGTQIPDDLRDDARRVTALRAAMLIELSVFPSEVATDRSPYPMLKELYDELLVDLADSVAAEESGMSPTNEVTGNMPAFGFPLVEGLLDKRM